MIAVGGGAVGYAISDQNTRTAKAQIAATEQRDAQIAAVMTASDASVHSETVPGGGTISVVVSAVAEQGRRRRHGHADDLDRSGVPAVVDPWYRAAVSARA